MNTPRRIEERIHPDKFGGNRTSAFKTRWRWTLTPHASLVSFAVFTVILITIFINPLVSLVIHAGRSDLNSYILLVPFISAYLVYLQRRGLPKDHTSSPGLAIIPFVAGLAGLAAAWGFTGSAATLSRNDYLALIALSFVCLLVTGGFLFIGRSWMSAVAFPFAFLIFLAPLPDAAVNWLETAFKLASAEVAGFLFSIAGTPVLRNGTVFQLPGITIEVAPECSGIRSTLVLFITSLLVSYLFLKSPWRRIALVAFVVPLGILRNGFRILVIGLLCVHVSVEMIHSAIHKRGGPLFFALSLIPLFLLLWWLRKGESAMASKKQKEMARRITATPPGK